jgi:hypothetical protein
MIEITSRNYSQRARIGIYLPKFYSKSSEMRDENHHENKFVRQLITIIFRGKRDQNVLVLICIQLLFHARGTIHRYNDGSWTIWIRTFDAIIITEPCSTSLSYASENQKQSYTRTGISSITAHNAPRIRSRGRKPTAVTEANVITPADGLMQRRN